MHPIWGDTRNADSTDNVHHRTQTPEGATMNTPTADVVITCGCGGVMKGVRGGPALTTLPDGWAHRVYLYRCPGCQDEVELRTTWRQYALKNANEGP